MNLIVAITTCPRPEEAQYLDTTVGSLGLGPVVIFNDHERRGSRWNVWRALRLGGQADRLLLLQDDVVAVPRLREIAAEIHIPDDVGFVSGHDFGDDFEYEQPPAGIHKFPAHRFGGIGLCGAQCLIMTGQHARWLAEQDAYACGREGPHGADYAIGWWTGRSPRPNKLIVMPKLVSHIGERSACWDEERRLAGAGIPHSPRLMSDWGL